MEPANNSAANQNEQDEIREISFQLQQIKKKHDEAKKMGNLKQDELYVEEVQAEGPSQDMTEKLG